MAIIELRGRLNDIHLTGYLLTAPRIIQTGDLEQSVFHLRVVHRKTEGYTWGNFDDILVFYSGEHLIPQIRQLHQLDLIDLQGILNITTYDEKSSCPGCGTINTLENTPLFTVYPIYINKLDALAQSYEVERTLPERILFRHHLEVSNQVLLVGTVMTEPEPVRTTNRYSTVARYCVGIEREIRIETQMDYTADYIWVYTFGNNAREDLTHLKAGAIVQIKGFLHTQKNQPILECTHCHRTYSYQTNRLMVVPYSVNYLVGHESNLDIAINKELLEQLRSEKYSAAQ